MTSALGPLRVLDFSRVLAGPYATMLLGDFGADVLKVERPVVGDDTRHWAPPYNAAGGATYFDAPNRNKRSIPLDLADAGDAQLARELAESADVVVENFLPGTMARRGLGYPELAAVNPALIYCSISGFGQRSTLPGYDLLVQAVGGLMSITGHPGDQVKVGVAVVDVLAGTNAAVGILAALQARARTGQGQLVEIDLLSTLLSGLVNQASGYLGAGVVPQATGNSHPSIAPYEVFQAADQAMVIAVGNDGQFAALGAALGVAWPERFATNAQRVTHRAELSGLIQQQLVTAPSAQWVARIRAVGVPCGPVNTLAGAFEFAVQEGLDVVAEVGTTRVVANPVRLASTPAKYRLPPPELGSGRARWLR